MPHSISVLITRTAIIMRINICSIRIIDTSF